MGNRTTEQISRLVEAEEGKLLLLTALNANVVLLVERVEVSHEGDADLAAADILAADEGLVCEHDPVVLLLD